MKNTFAVCFPNFPQYFKLNQDLNDLDSKMVLDMIKQNDEAIAYIIFDESSFREYEWFYYLIKNNSPSANLRAILLIDKSKDQHNSPFQLEDNIFLSKKLQIFKYFVSFNNSLVCLSKLIADIEDFALPGKAIDQKNKQKIPESLKNTRTNSNESTEKNTHLIIADISKLNKFQQVSRPKNIDIPVNDMLSPSEKDIDSATIKNIDWTSEIKKIVQKSPDQSHISSKSLIGYETYRKTILSSKKNVHSNFTINENKYSNKHSSSTLTAGVLQTNKKNDNDVFIRNDKLQNLDHLSSKKNVSIKNLECHPKKCQKLLKSCGFYVKKTCQYFTKTVAQKFINPNKKKDAHILNNSFLSEIKISSNQLTDREHFIDLKPKRIGSSNFENNLTAISRQVSSNSENFYRENYYLVLSENSQFNNSLFEADKSIKRMALNIEDFSQACHALARPAKIGLAKKTFDLKNQCYMCIDQEILRKAWKSKDIDNVLMYIAVLKKIFNLKVLVFYEDTQNCQDESINELKGIKFIDGKIAITENENLVSNLFDLIDGNLVYHMIKDFTTWYKILKVEKNQNYIIFEEKDKAGLFYNNKKTYNEGLFSLLQIIYKDRLKQQILFKNNKKKKSAERSFVKNNPVVYEFMMNSPANNNDVNEDFEQIVLENKSATFHELKLILGLKLYNYYGIRIIKTENFNKIIKKFSRTIKVEENIFAQQLFSKHSENSIRQMEAISFIKQYKNNSKDFFAPGNDFTQPLYGLGSAIAIAYLLQDTSFLKDFQSLNYINKNGYNELVLTKLQDIFNYQNTKEDGEDNATLLVNNDTINGQAMQIFYDQLCSQDKLEFKFVIKRLKSVDALENDIWDEVINSCYKEQFVSLKHRYINQKKFMINMFSKLFDKGIGTSILKNNYLFQNKDKKKIVCIDIVALQKIMKTSDFESLNFMLLFLTHTHHYKIYVMSKYSKSIQDEIILENNVTLPIEGQIIMVNSKDFSEILTYDTKNNRNIYFLNIDYQTWFQFFDTNKEDLYFIFAEQEKEIKIYNDNNIKKYENVDFFVKNFYVNLQIMNSKNFDPTCSCLHDALVKKEKKIFTYNNLVMLESDAQLVIEQNKPTRMFNCKEILDLNVFQSFKTIISFAIFSHFNIIAPYSCLVLKAINNGLPSPGHQEFRCMTEFIEGCKSVEQDFIQHYKSNKKYFYFPNNQNSKPLFGFGSTLAIFSILKCHLNDVSLGIGLIEKENFFEIVLFDATSNNNLNRNQLTTLTYFNYIDYQELFYEILCKHDQLEFILTLVKLKNTDIFEHDFKYLYTLESHVDEVKEVNKDWEIKKNILLELFSGLIQKIMDFNIVNPYFEELDANFFVENEEMYFTQEKVFIAIENEKLGIGTFGSVYEGYLKEDPDQKIAVKKIFDKKGTLKNSLSINAGKETLPNTTKSDYDREIEILRALEIYRSPYFPQYYGAQLLINENGYCSLEVGIELCDGDLDQYLNELKKQKKKLNQKEIFEIFWQIVEGLFFLHKYNIMHRDLKPKNILYKTINSDQQSQNKAHAKIWKICDFGLALNKEKGVDKRGTPAYMAPEVQHGLEYDKSVDIWSLGLILHKLLFGIDYYDINSLDAQYNLTADEMCKIDEITKKLLFRMIEPNPKLRLSMEELLNFKTYYSLSNDVFLIIREYDNKKEKQNRMKLNKIQKRKIVQIKTQGEAQKIIETANLMKSLGFIQKSLNMLLEVLNFLKKLSIKETDRRYAEIFNLLGDCYTSLSKNEKAAKYHKNSAHILKVCDNDDNDFIYSVYKKIGQSLGALEKFEEAIQYYEMVFNYYIQKSKEESLIIGAFYEKVVKKFESFNMYTEALNLYHNILRIKILYNPNKKEEIGNLHYKIANAFEKLGDYQEAKRNYNAAISFYEKKLCNSSVDLINIFDNIAKVCTVLKEYEDALQYYQQALEIRIQICPKNYPDIAKNYENIGIVNELMQKYDSAKNFYILSLETFTQYHYKSNPQKSALYIKMINSFKSLKNYEILLDHYKLSIALRTKSNQADNYGLGITHYAIGCVYYILNNYELALNHFQRLLMVEYNKNDECQTQIFSICNQIGEILFQIEKKAESLKYYNKNLTISEQIWSEQSEEKLKMKKMINLLINSELNF